MHERVQIKIKQTSFAPLQVKLSVRPYDLETRLVIAAPVEEKQEVTHK